jgi:hypothetical protein
MLGTSSVSIREVNRYSPESNWERRITVGNRANEGRVHMKICN